MNRLKKEVEEKKKREKERKSEIDQRLKAEAEEASESRSSSVSKEELLRREVAELESMFLKFKFHYYTQMLN